jgi:hypothetical protein
VPDAVCVTAISMAALPDVSRCGLQRSGEGFRECRVSCCRAFIVSVSLLVVQRKQGEKSPFLIFFVAKNFVRDFG